MIAAVTGATGLVGRFVVERLTAEGVAIRAWRHLGSDLAGLPSAIEWVDGALGSPDAAGRLVEGVDMLVHCALDHAPGRFRGGEGDDLRGFLRTNVGGGLDLLAAARAAGVERCVVLSSRAVFGGGLRDGPIGDDAPVAPDTHYGATKAALEAFVQSFGGDGWPIAALRPTGVYGLTTPVQRSKWFGLIGAALDGETVAARAGTEVHGRDVADAVWRLLTASPRDIAGRMFNCSDLVVQNRDVVRLAHAAAAASGPLPQLAPEPNGVMSCERLQRLGSTFGGEALLGETVAALVDAIRTPPRRRP